MSQDLPGLVRRRLYELDLSAEEASRRSRGGVPREMMRALMGGSWGFPLSDRLVRALARLLEVPERRVRRAAGLPVPEFIGERTRPHLRVVRSNE
jgi:hypothetical protein